MYVTHFDSAYLSRALVLVRSLRQVGESAQLIVVCFDDESAEVMARQGDPALRVVRLAELERAFPGLPAVRADRSKAEYFYTCAPWVTQLAMAEVAEGGWAVYLDADMMFFSEPGPIFADLADSDVGIVAHDFLPGHEGLNSYGHYNVGWVSFRKSPNGRKVLDWWADRCLEWCADIPSEGRFADQGYLDYFDQVADGVRTITAPGARLAPWNLDARDVVFDGQVLVDGEPLIYYHFVGLRRQGRRYVAMHLNYGTHANDCVRDHVYAPYAAQLRALANLDRQSRVGKRGRGWRGAADRMRHRWWYLRARLRGESWPAAAATSQTS